MYNCKLKFYLVSPTISNLGFKSIGHLELSDAIMESEHEDGDYTTNSDQYIDHVYESEEEITKGSITSPASPPENWKEGYNGDASEYIEIVWSKAFCQKMLSGNYVKVSVETENEGWLKH